MAEARAVAETRPPKAGREGAVPADRLASLTRELAKTFAKRRTGGNVYMDGSHNPLPTEITEARRFMEMVEYVLDMTQEQYEQAEAKTGYPTNTNMEVD